MSRLHIPKEAYNITVLGSTQIPIDFNKTTKVENWL